VKFTKYGSALGVCTSRTSEPFVSDADVQGGAIGVTVTATFEVIRAGQVREHKLSYLTDTTAVESGALSDLPNRAVGTTEGHIFRYAVAHASTSRPCRAVEIGLKSTLGARINGLCNFQEAKKYSTIDRDFCQAFTNEDADDILNIFHQSGVISTPFERYAFFRIKWRDYGDTNWNYLNNTYGARSESQQATFNYIRFEFATDKQREFMFEPVAGYEVRNSLDGGSVLYVLDYKKTTTTVSENGCDVVFAGGAVARSADTFGINEASGVPGLDSFYSYLTQTSGHTHAADVAVEFTILAGETTATNVELGISTSDEGQINLPLLVGQDFSGTLPGTDSVLGAVSVSGSMERTSGAPDEDEYFTFTADAAMTNDTTFAVGATFTVTGDSRYIIYKGLPKTDTNTYIDDYAKLAETFVYSEISTTAKGGPEHEIVYVNEIVPNDIVPLYDDLALVGINIRSSAEFQQFAQFSVYVTGGKECTRMLGGSGATHLFPDVLYDLMTNTRYGAGTFIKSYMIDTTEFATAAQWCLDRKYFYDAAVAEPINVRQWAADLAATHFAAIW